jgi:hypothetical protein
MKVSDRANDFVVVAALWASKESRDGEHETTKVRVKEELEAALSKENLSKIIHETYLVSI